MSATEPTVRDLNLQRKRLRCLQCGEFFWTDRCHRRCTRCKRVEDCRGQRGIAYGVELTER